MRPPNRYLLVFLAVGAGACRDHNVPLGGDFVGQHTGSVVDGSYIVVFRHDAADHAALAKSLIASHGGSLGRVYTLAFRGFSARLSDRVVAALRAHPKVMLVDQNHVIKVDTTQQWNQQEAGNGGLWGLGRIDQRMPPGLLEFIGKYSWYHNGTGVTAYIMDTGLDSAHADFTGRGKNVFDSFGEGGQDCNGHGTHVAGIVGSRTHGVAKGALLRGVRVLDCFGGGNDTTVIDGIEWLLANHVKPAVVNMSLGGSFSEPLNLAVQSLVDSGLFVAVAAGNDNLNACAFSPSSAPNAFTVAATKQTLSGNGDVKAEFSNWGSCVDMYAPGRSIQSTRLGGGSASTMSGTSQAAPFITGTAAIFKSAFGDSLPSVIANWIIANSTAGVVGSNPPGTPNRLVYKAPDL